MASSSATRLAQFHGATKYLQDALGSGHWPAFNLQDFTPEYLSLVKVIGDLIDLIRWQPGQGWPELPPHDFDCFGVALSHALVDTMDRYLDKETKKVIDKAYYDKVDSRLEEFGEEWKKDWRKTNPIHSMIQMASNDPKRDKTDVLLLWIRLWRQSASGVDSQLWLILLKTILYALVNMVGNPINMMEAFLSDARVLPVFV